MGRPSSWSKGRSERVTDSAFRVKFWGTRGSLPVSGSDNARYGGNTICMQISCGEEHLLFDAGSGLPLAGRALDRMKAHHLHLFMTHFHYDHIIGLPFFCPLFTHGATVTLWSGNLEGQMTTREVLRQIMKPPFFPVSPDICSAHVRCNDFKAGAVLEPFAGAKLVTGALNHPGGAIGYRVEWKGKVVAFITDTEHNPGELDANVLALIRDADLFVYDGAYEEAEMDKFRGFGHSTWQQAVLLAREANVKQTAIFHHSPMRTDDMLDAMEARAKAELPSLFFARDLQDVTL